jgi:hypothetical protein
MSPPLQNTNKYKHQISNILQNAWEILVAIPRIARTIENRRNMQKLCGRIPRALTCTHLFALQIFWQSTAGFSKKQAKKSEILQKSASFNPSGLREIMHFGRLVTTL